MVDERYYKIQEAAEILACDDETILSWIHSGELDAVNICKSPSGKRPTWRIPESGLGRHLISRRHPASQQVAPANRQTRKQTKQYV